MKIEITISNYESGAATDLHSSEIEEALRLLLDERGDDGVIEVAVKG